MVAYSFRPRFVQPILTGTKRQTIRADRKRHARPGETLQLYTGMRTRQCHLIGRATCLSVDPIRIEIIHGRVTVAGDVYDDQAGLDAFSCRDGFTGWDALCEFWREYHDDPPEFSGMMIRWKSLEGS